MEKMNIKEIIGNMIGELERAEEVLSWLYTKHPGIYSEIQNGELGDILTQDIRDEIERTEDIFERIDLCMLMAATIGEDAIGIPEICNIYDNETEIEIPYCDNYVDTETVYNMLDEWCEIGKEKLLWQ